MLINLPADNIYILQGDFHQLGPLGRVGLVVAKSVCVLRVCPLPMRFFR